MIEKGSVSNHTSWVFVGPVRLYQVGFSSLFRNYQGSVAEWTRRRLPARPLIGQILRLLISHSAWAARRR